MSQKSRKSCLSGTTLATLVVRLLYSIWRGEKTNLGGSEQLVRAMDSKKHMPASSGHWALARGFWAVMLAGHSPALTSSFRNLLTLDFSADRLLAFSFVFTAMIFFAAKLFDLPSLRVRLNRHSFMVLILAVAVLHAGCLDSDYRFQLVADGILVLSAATVFLVACCVCRRRDLEAVNESLAARLLAILGAHRRTVWLDQSRPHCWVLASDLLHLRAPPA